MRKRIIEIRRNGQRDRERYNARERDRERDTEIYIGLYLKIYIFINPIKQASHIRSSYNNVSREQFIK